MIVEPDEAKVEQELLPHFAQLNRATKRSFYKAYSEEELAAIGDFSHGWPVPDARPRSAQAFRVGARGLSPIELPGWEGRP